MIDPAVALRGVVKRSGKVTALDAISATIEAGQLVGLVGPDGAGKTTLIRLIAGLLRPDDGRVEVFGRDAVGEAAAVQAMIGYMPQRFGFYEDLTVIENLELHADLRNVTGEGRRVRIEELLHLTDLTRSRSSRVSVLSVDMKQRLGLACALVGTPRLLLLDEPSVAVDPVSRRDLFRIAQALTGQGMAVLWSTPRFDEAERCPHLLLLNEGRIIGQGTPASLGAGLAGRVHAIRAIGAERRHMAARLRCMPRVGSVEIRGTMVRFLTDTPDSDAELDRFASIGALRAVASRLEDSFIDRLAGQSPPAAAPSPAPRPPNAGGPAIEIRRLTKRFGGVTAVDGVDLTVARGEIFGIVGPSGAGKTTILRILCGLQAPTEGEARIAGLDLRSAPALARARLGYMNQGFSLYGELSVAQNLRFFAGACKVERRRRRERVDRLIAEHGLEPYAHARAGELSAGNKQRLALAVTLIHEPDIVLLDQPTAGVDPQTGREIWQRIEAVAAAGVAVLVASPFAVEAECCDRVLLLHRGCGLAAGTPDELMADTTAGRTDPTIEDVFIELIEGRERKDAA